MTMSDDEILARLRAADPAARVAPLDASQVATLVEGATGSLPARRRVTWLAGAAAAAVVLVGGTLFALQGGDDRGDDTLRADSGQTAPATVPSVALVLAPTMGKCLAPNADFLRNVGFAFAGTVTAVDGDQVTLTPTTTYTGEPAQTVTVTAPTNPESAVSFTVGGTYLVAATGGSVIGCGFSGPATPDLQAIYDEAFPP